MAFVCPCSVRSLLNLPWPATSRSQAWAESLRRPQIDGRANRYSGSTHGMHNPPAEHVEDELRRYMGVTPSAESMWRSSGRRAIDDLLEC